MVEDRRLPEGVGLGEREALAVEAMRGRVSSGVGDPGLRHKPAGERVGERPRPAIGLGLADDSARRIDLLEARQKGSPIYDKSKDRHTDEQQTYYVSIDKQEFLAKKTPQHRLRVISTPP